jgi:tellurite resistance protein TerC
MCRAEAAPTPPGARAAVPTPTEEASPTVHVAPWVWIATVGVAVALLALDVFYLGRRPHEPTMKEAGGALAFYIGFAVLFGLGVLAVSGPDYGGQFFAGWLTEYSLSIDNLFVFLIIMTRLDVPRKYQPTALLVGIVLALVLRGVFIALGAAAISEFSWIFYVFGLFLILAGVRLARDQGGSEADFEENRVIRWIRRVVPTSAKYDGVRLTTREAGRRVVTPMFIVLVALGTTDLLFALDSIPAIYGLTQEPYLVLMANIFALMGLRQLYFLIGGLLQRLVYLSIGLAILLGFIGVKLVLHALHENELPFINGGEHVSWAPDLPIWFSLLFIVGTLAVTVFASMLHDRRVQRAAQSG